MKRLQGVCLLLICGLLVLAGCGREAEDSMDTEMEQIESGEEAAETEAEEEAEMGAWLAPRELENEELREFTAWINKGNNYGNYGFLLSEYTRPQDVDLNQLFYSGAGMSTERLTAEEEKAYLELSGQEEIYTDCERLSTAQINEFLERKLGLSLEDMTKGLDWYYLPDSDVWVSEHGDTNYMNFTCVSGRQISADTYELECVPGDGDSTPYLPSCRLTLQERDGDYRPRSNIYIERLEFSKEIWKIEDQSFDVDLGGIWGNVTFTSYYPDLSAYGNRDVMFSLVKDGKEVYEFPAVCEDNYRQREVFNQLLAVSFQDYDGDGDKDILIIAEYKTAVHTEEGDTLLELRIYRNQAEEGDFLLDTDRMDYLNMNGYNHTISEAAAHIDEAFPDEE